MARDVAGRRAAGSAAPPRVSGERAMVLAECGKKEDGVGAAAAAVAVSVSVAVAVAVAEERAAAGMLLVMVVVGEQLISCCDMRRDGSPCRLLSTI